MSWKRAEMKSAWAGYRCWVLLDAQQWRVKWQNQRARGGDIKHGKWSVLPMPCTTPSLKNELLSCFCSVVLYNLLINGFPQSPLQPDLAQDSLCLPFSFEFSFETTCSLIYKMSKEAFTSKLLEWDIHSTTVIAFLRLSFLLASCKNPCLW